MVITFKFIAKNEKEEKDLLEIKNGVNYRNRLGSLKTVNAQSYLTRRGKTTTFIIVVKCKGRYNYRIYMARMNNKKRVSNLLYRLSKLADASAFATLSNEPMYYTMTRDDIFVKQRLSYRVKINLTPEIGTEHKFHLQIQINAYDPCYQEYESRKFDWYPTYDAYVPASYIKKCMSEAVEKMITESSSK